MLRNAALLAVFATAMAAIPDSCPSYTTYSAASHPPLSPGKYQFPYMRPNATCRTYKVPKVEETIKDMKKTIKDPDLFRLFQNTWPNTVDTTVSWTGAAADNANEEVMPHLFEPDIVRLTETNVVGLHHHWRYRCHVAA